LSTDLELPLNSHPSISNPIVHSLCATSRRTWQGNRRRWRRMTRGRSPTRSCVTRWWRDKSRRPMVQLGTRYSPEPGLASGVQDAAFTYVGRLADGAGSEISWPRECPARSMIDAGLPAAFGLHGKEQSGRTAGLATERKPRLSASEFRFGPIVSSGPASRRIDACSVSAQGRAVAKGFQMRGAGAKQERERRV
jgi:hypothetical protein